MSSHRVAVLLAAVVLCGGLARAAPATGGLLWTGFNHTWLRHVVGFQTPHRMGSIESSFTPTTNSSASVFAADYHVTFTPGVDGDFSHPTAAFVCAAGSDVGMHAATATLNFTDTASTGTYPSADSSQHAVVTVPVPAGVRWAAFLDGFAVSMRCVGTTCNSNGVWPYHLAVGVACTPAAAANTLACGVTFELGRGWTPSHGGGKAFNTNMAYNVSVGVRVVTSSALQVSRHSATAAGTMFSGAQSGSVNVTTTGRVLAGMSGFGFTLPVTNGHDNRGRYIESLAFGVTEAAAPGQFNWVANVAAPKATTYAADVAYVVNATAVVLPTGAALSAPGTVTGTVCEDDPPLFHCKGHNLPLSLSDVVPFKCGV